MKKNRYKEEIWRMLRESDARHARMEQQHEKFVRDMEEMRAYRKKTEKMIYNTNKHIAKLTDSWGDFVEGLVVPNVAVVFSSEKIKIKGLSENPTRHVNGDTMEVDILAVGRRNGKEKIVIVLEVKAKLTVSVVRDTEERLKKFHVFFDEYKGYKVIGAVAGMKIPKEAQKFAERKGFYVLAPNGETMLLLNKKGFRPKGWG